MPAVPFPPGTPFTLQVTAVFVALVTVAANVTEFPSRTEELDTETVTTMLGVGGGGGAEVTEAAPLLQPGTQNGTVSSTRNHSVPVLKLAFALRERGRMTRGQRRRRASEEIQTRSWFCGPVLPAQPLPSRLKSTSCADERGPLVFRGLEQEKSKENDTVPIWNRHPRRLFQNGRRVWCTF